MDFDRKINRKDRRSYVKDLVTVQRDVIDDSFQSVGKCRRNNFCSKLMINVELSRLSLFHSRVEFSNFLLKQNGNKLKSSQFIPLLE